MVVPATSEGLSYSEIISPKYEQSILCGSYSATHEGYLPGRNVVENISYKWSHPHNAKNIAASDDVVPNRN